MGSSRRFYEGTRWRIGRFVLGIVLIAIAIRTGASSVPWSILLLLAIGLILSAVPWKKLPELTADTEMEKVIVILELSNDLLWDLSVVELRGSARLDAQTISQDLRLSEPASNYQLRRLRPSKIKVNFPIEAGIIDQLNDKREQENKAYWEFELEWKLKFPSGEEVVWRPKETQFEAVPSIEKSQGSR